MGFRTWVRLPPGPHMTEGRYKMYLPSVMYKYDKKSNLTEKAPAFDVGRKTSSGRLFCADRSGAKTRLPLDSRCLFIYINI